MWFGQPMSPLLNTRVCHCGLLRLALAPPCGQCLAQCLPTSSYDSIYFCMIDFELRTIAASVPERQQTGQRWMCFLMTECREACAQKRYELKQYGLSSQLRSFVAILPTSFKCFSTAVPAHHQVQYPGRPGCLSQALPPNAAPPCVSSFGIMGVLLPCLVLLLQALRLKPNI